MGLLVGGDVGAGDAEDSACEAEPEERFFSGEETVADCYGGAGDGGFVEAAAEGGCHRDSSFSKLMRFRALYRIWIKRHLDRWRYL
jgi:hypothetical protein